jgi:hypothetical protein
MAAKAVRLRPYNLRNIFNCLRANVGNDVPDIFILIE